MKAQVKRMALVGGIVMAVAICAWLWLHVAQPWYRDRAKENLNRTATDEPPSQTIVQKREEQSHQTTVTHVGVFDAKPSDGKTLAQMNRLCAVNCLYLINQYYGIKCHYSDLQRIVAPTDMGTSLQRLKEVAEALGYVTETRMLPVEMLCTLETPTIVLAQPENQSSVGHFVVVTRASEDGTFLLYDPPYKKRLVQRGELAEGKGKSAPALFLRYEGREGGVTNTVPGSIVPPAETQPTQSRMQLPMN